MKIVAELKDQESRSLATFNLPTKVFKTGSRGFYASGKVEIEGKRYQVQIQLVEIGSKNRLD
jgi:hypothetical protein